jgi:hypothetical protein
MVPSSVFLVPADRNLHPDLPIISPTGGVCLSQNPRRRGKSNKAFDTNPLRRGSKSYNSNWFPR